MNYLRPEIFYFKAWRFFEWFANTQRYTLWSLCLILQPHVNVYTGMVVQSYLSLEGTNTNCYG